MGKMSVLNVRHLSCLCAGVRHPLEGDILSPCGPSAESLNTTLICCTEVRLPVGRVSHRLVSFTSVLSSVLSRLLRLPRISSSRLLFVDTFASDEEKHYAWMKRGRGKAAAAVGEIIHVAEDKCIFSTRLIPCTHFQPPCTSTSFYIPRSIRIIPSSSPSSSSPSLPPPGPPG